jgi:hypothetical protein
VMNDKAREQGRKERDSTYSSANLHTVCKVRGQSDLLSSVTCLAHPRKILYLRRRSKSSAWASIDCSCVEHACTACMPSYLLFR